MYQSKVSNIFSIIPLNKRGGSFIVLFLLVVAPVFGDILNGIFGASELSTSFGSGIRMCVIAFSFLLVLNNISGVMSIASLLCLLLISCVVTIQNDSITNWNSYVELNQGAKFLYTPLLAAAIATWLKYYCPKNVDAVLKITMWSGTLLAAFVTIPTAAGFGATVYRYASFGSKGLLMSQNDVGLALLISLIIAVYLALTKKFIYFIHTLLIFSALFIIGSRTGIVGVVCSLFIITVVMVWFATMRRKKKPVINRWSLLSLILMLCCAITIVYYIVNSNPYFVNKLQQLSNPIGVRGDLFLAGKNALGTFSSGELIVGVGHSGWIELVRENTDAIGRSVLGRKTEVDWLDIAGSYGFLTLLFILLYYVTPLLIATKRLFINSSLVSLPCLLGIGCFVLHGLLAGHAFMSPLPGTFVAPLLAIVCFKYQITFSRSYKNN